MKTLNKTNQNNTSSQQWETVVVKLRLIPSGKSSAKTSTKPEPVNPNWLVLSEWGINGRWETKE